MNKSRICAHVGKIGAFIFLTRSGFPLLIIKIYIYVLSKTHTFLYVWYYVSLWVRKKVASQTGRVRYLSSHLGWRQSTTVGALKPSFTEGALVGALVIIPMLLR